MNHYLVAATLLAAPSITFAGMIDASTEQLGIYPPHSFETTTGACQHCSLSAQARWYFDQEIISVAKKANAPVSPSLQQPVTDDQLPPLIWTGSTKVMNGVTLSSDGKHIDTADGAIAFSIVPKLATNLSFFNQATHTFYAGHRLRLRGEFGAASDGTPQFVARTMWPEDYAVKPAASAPLGSDETLRGLVKADGGGAQSAFSTRVLWQRHPGQDWRGKSVVGLMLNGAQGDDDEAHGGHFGIVTGNVTDGSMHHWLVNNFYGVNSISEKGIIAAVTPMDKYLMDLNNGQSFYRPSYMLVAILNNDSTARQYQNKVNRRFEQLYRHDFEYDHSKENCAGISSDVFRQLGWRIPTLANHDRIKAVPAYVFAAATKRSLQEGLKMYDYFTEEPTRLFPAATFDAMGDDLLAMAQHKTVRPLTQFEQDIADQLEAIVFVRIPQIPSSRVFGLAPVVSIAEYLKQAPADRTQWKIVPGTPHPFPDTLRNRPAPVPPAFPVPFPVLISALTVLGVIFVTLSWFTKRRRRAR